jgi:hypothetical protein
LCLTHSSRDRLQHTSTICHHIAIAESKDAKSLRSKKRIAPFVPRFVSFFEMLSAIDLGDQLRGVRDEIDDVRTDRSLTAKACAFEAMRTEAVPDGAFSFGQVLP